MPTVRVAVAQRPISAPATPGSEWRRVFARVLPFMPASAPPQERDAPLEYEPALATERHGRLLIAALLLYLTLFVGWLLLSHTWPAPDLIVVAFLIFAILSAQGLRFLRDWTPFLVLLLAYVGLTGVAPGVVERAHVGFPITVDRWLGGGELPTTRLQAALWDGRYLHWYDWFTALIYLLHFVAPLVLAFLLWHWRRALYWRFVSAYVLLMGAALVTYVVYPMAPPWWAGDLGRIPPVARVLGAVQWQGVTNPVVLLSKYFKTDPVAAMPSMHAAFPVLVWLVLWRLWPRWGWTAIAYPLGMAFAVVYAGEHYVIDVLTGWLYATIAFLVVWQPWRSAAPAAPRPAAVPAPRRRIRVLQPLPAVESRFVAEEAACGDGD